MKNIKSILLFVALMSGVTNSHAQSVSDLLKGLGNGGDIGSTIGNVIEGVFTKTDLSLQDLVGEYVSSGPAVAFKSDNFLQKAGGIAGAAALETKLKPYYEQYGLNGMPLTIDSDANFTLTVMRIKLNGTIEKNDGDGIFRFILMVGGKMKIGEFTAYVEKSGKNLNLMFDATKLKEIISMVGKLTGTAVTKTLAGLLDSYEGACVGFKMEYSGNGVEHDVSGGNRGDASGDSTSTQPSGSGLESLRDLLSKKRR